MAESKTSRKAEEVEEPRVSTDLRHATYTENKDLEQTVPPPGRHVVQELGVPSE
jgi:hypothetical protein